MRNPAANGASSRTLWRFRPAGIWIVVACHFTPGCAPADTDEWEMIEPPLAVGELLHGSVARLADDLQLSRVVDLAVAGDTITVLDGEGRLVLVDHALEYLGELGRPGAVPGELRGAHSVQCRERRCAVSEMTNGRISFFDLESGRFERSVQVEDGLAGAFAWLDGDSLLVRGMGPSYLAIVAHDGEARSVGPAAGDGEGSAAAGPAVMDLLAGGDEHAFWIHNVHWRGDEANPDGRSGRVLRISPATERVVEGRVPRAPLQGMHERAERILASLTPGRAASAGGSGQLMTHASVGPDGRLFLLFPRSTTDGIGMLVEPDLAAARWVRVPDDHPYRSELAAAARAARLPGGGLLIASGGSLYLFELDVDRAVPPLPGT